MFISNRNGQETEHACILLGSVVYIKPGTENKPQEPGESPKAEHVDVEPQQLGNLLLGLSSSRLCSACIESCKPKPPHTILTGWCKRHSYA